jgi:hypothetical protein
MTACTKACVACGTELPARLVYPKKSRVLWFVRELDPVTGQSKDHPCRSSEDADDFIRRKERDFTRDPVQERLLEHSSVLVRQIRAGTYDEAVNTLITKLGGDPVARTLKPIVVEALRDLRSHPVVVAHQHTSLADRAVGVDGNGRAVDQELVFPIRGYQCPANETSDLFADLCIRAGLTNQDGKNKWSLHDLRRKANDDIMRAGGTLREAMSLTGHSTAEVNWRHYQSPAELVRMQELTSSMSGFKGLRLVRESA